MLRRCRYSSKLSCCLLVLLLPILLLTGCQKKNSSSGFALPDPLLSRESLQQSVAEIEDNTVATESPAIPVTRVVETPKALGFAVPEVKSQDIPSFPYPDKELADINFHNMPLPAFINEVYGNILDVSFEVDPKLNKIRDLITLRTGSEQAPAQLDSLARQVLANYGVAVTRQDDLLRFVASSQATEGVPLLVSGRALPEVPESNRPVFQMVPLTVVRNNHVRGWLKETFAGQELQIFEDPERNAIILKGSAAVVKQALAAVALLDQPYMRGRHSLRIEPLFLGAEELTKLLVQVLQSEGYSASLKPPMGSIIILPVGNLNAVLVFAATADILAHVKDWAINLDKPGEQTGEKSIYFYDVENTTAVDIGKAVNQLLLGTNVSPLPANAGGAQSTKSSQTFLSDTGAKNKVVVDELRNSLIFRGDPNEWQEILNLIRHFDKPAKQVLVEVTIAEITLIEDQNLGIEWLFDVTTDDLTGLAGTLGGLGIGSSGFSFNLDSGGETRAMLNAFASKDLVDIVSTPRIMVKSGTTASIDVGTDVPTLTSQQASSELSEEGNTGILQTIEYRKTGVLLSVKPTVYSGNRVALEVTQEMSEVSTRTASDIKSPAILTRRIETSLTLRDGGSVLLGGLIYTTTGKGSSGIPWLMDIPYLGQLFSVDSVNETRTMLVMLIVPYIVENDEDAMEITEAMKVLLPSR